MLTTFLIGRPVNPSHAPLRTFAAKALILASTSCTSGTTSRPPTRMRLAVGRAQRHMQNGAALGDIDRLARKHGIDPLAQARLLGKLDEQLQRGRE